MKFVYLQRTCCVFQQVKSKGKGYCCILSYTPLIFFLLIAAKWTRVQFNSAENGIQSMCDDISTGEQPICYNVGNIHHSKATVISTTSFPFIYPHAAYVNICHGTQAFCLTKCQNVYVNNMKKIWRRQVVVLVKSVMVSKIERKVCKDIRSNIKGTWHQLR